jgi:N-methylhydantoinase A
MLRGDGLTADALRAAAGDAGEVAWDVRYAGQSHELTLRGIEPEPDAVRAALAAAHEDRYGYAEPGGAVEVVTVRRTRREPGPELDLATEAAQAERPGPCRIALPGSTLLVPDGWSARPAPAGCLLLERT